MVRVPLKGSAPARAQGHCVAWEPLRFPHWVPTETPELEAGGSWGTGPQEEPKLGWGRRPREMAPASSGTSRPPPSSSVAELDGHRGSRPGSPRRREAEAERSPGAGGRRRRCARGGGGRDASRPPLGRGRRREGAPRLRLVSSRGRRAPCARAAWHECLGRTKRRGARGGRPPRRPAAPRRQ